LEGMTMRYFVGTLLTVGLLLAVTNSSRANDVIRLGGPSAQLNTTGGTDTDLVRGYGRGYGGYGGYRGGYYGGYRGYYGGYGYGYGYGYYRPYYYRPYYYSSYYYQPYYSSYVAPYYYPTNYYAQPSYYYPCVSTPAPIVAGAGAGAGAGPAVYAQTQTKTYTYTPGTLVRPTAPVLAPYYQNGNPLPPVLNGNQVPPGQNGNGTFPYDGGPTNPVPLPVDPAIPTNGQPSGNVVPLDGKLVSLPHQTTGGIASVVTPEIQKLRYVSLTNTSTTSSNQPSATPITYPAYGEQAIVPVRRK